MQGLHNLLFASTSKALCWYHSFLYEGNLSTVFVSWYQDILFELYGICQWRVYFSLFSLVSCFLLKDHQNFKKWTDCWGCNLHQALAQIIEQLRVDSEKYYHLDQPKPSVLMSFRLSHFLCPFYPHDFSKETWLNDAVIHLTVRTHSFCLLWEEFFRPCLWEI